MLDLSVKRLENGKRPCQNLSRRQRERTPLFMAKVLVDLVKEEFAVERVAVLWAMYRSNYSKVEGCEVWTESKDARLYAGPHPIIAHPPCGPWGVLRWACKYQSKEHGILAIDFVHRWGGVVEQPVGSQLFKLHGREGAKIVTINQGDYGHAALKPTLLYWVTKDALAQDV